MDRKTKIVATIGPASQSEDAIRRLFTAGVNVARLNFSHGTQADHRVLIKRLRRIGEEMQRPVCILMDLQGPKIRIGKLPEEGILLQEGQPLILSTQIETLETGEIPVDFKELPEAVHSGDRILLDDGNLELQVESVAVGRVLTKVIIGGRLYSHKGINLPETHLPISALTEKDIDDLEFGLKQGVDFIALSFVRSEQDILQLREIIKSIHPSQEKIAIIAKLERPEALDHLDEILDVADGVMVARGDLGGEMSPQEVPIAQKRIIESANQHVKVVITATQMLESMIQKPRPTRAEASDVANAIFDGTDAVMLSGETAVGNYPFKSVEMMNQIVRQAEAHVDDWGHWHGPAGGDSNGDDTVFMSLAVRELAHDRNVDAIAVFTMSGSTALHVSKTRPGVPILAFTPNQSTYNRLQLYWGVTAYLVPQSDTLEEMIEDVEAVMKRTHAVTPGQQVALTCGFPVATVNPTNLVLLHTIRD